MNPDSVVCGNRLIPLVPRYCFQAGHPGAASSWGWLLLGLFECVAFVAVIALVVVKASRR
jgi:hypothetical protein